MAKKYPFKYNYARVGGFEFYREANTIRFSYKGKNYAYPCLNGKDFKAIFDFLDVFHSLTNEGAQLYAECCIDG